MRTAGGFTVLFGWGLGLLVALLMVGEGGLSEFPAAFAAWAWLAGLSYALGMGLALLGPVSTQAKLVESKTVVTTKGQERQMPPKPTKREKPNTARGWVEPRG